MFTKQLKTVPIGQRNAITAEGKQQLYNIYQDVEWHVKRIRKKVADILIEWTITFGELQTIVDVAHAINKG